MKYRAELADIIIADGRSSDGATAPETLRPSRVRALLTTDDRGLSTATRMGLTYAMAQGYQGIITMDGNGKDGVEAVPDFITALNNGYDLVQGSRFMQGGRHKNTPLDRHLGIRFVVVPLLWMACGFRYTDPTNAFRAMSMRFLCDTRVQPLRHFFVRFNLQQYIVYRAAKLKFKVKEIPVTRLYPEDGSVPTKIHGVRTKILFTLELIATVSGKYNPK